MQPQTSSLIFLQYLTTVFDNITEVILLVGVESKDQFRLLLANNAFYHSTGHTNDIIGKKLQDIVHVDTYAPLVRQYKKVLKTKRPFEYTSWFKTPKGRRAYRVKLLPILNTVGDCVQIAALLNDKTEVSKLQEEIRQLRIALEVPPTPQT